MMNIDYKNNDWDDLYKDLEGSYDLYEELNNLLTDEYNEQAYEQIEAIKEEIEDLKLQSSALPESDAKIYLSAAMLVWFLLSFFGTLIRCKGMICGIFATKASLLVLASCFQIVQLTMDVFSQNGKLENGKYLFKSIISYFYNNNLIKMDIQLNQ